MGSWMSGIRWEETELVALRLSPPPSQIKTQLSNVGIGSPPSAGSGARFVRIEGNFLADDRRLEGGSASGREAVLTWDEGSRGSEAACLAGA